jgi:DNA-directed RNA polymerase specialized sigma24 family protein
MCDLMRDLPAARRRAEKYLASGFSCLSHQTREDILQDSLADIIRKTNRGEEIGTLSGLLIHIAHHRAHRVFRRERHRATPILVEDTELDGPSAPSQEASARLEHDLPVLAMKVSNKLGGKRPRLLEAALVDLVKTGELVVVIARRHRIDRALLSRARCALAAAWLA